MNWKIVSIGFATIIVLLVVGFAIKSAVAPNSFNLGTVTESTNTKSTYNLATGSNSQTAVTSNTPIGNVQNAQLALVDFKYVLTPNKLVKGVPVRVVVDSSTLSGCMKTVVIRDFGVNKYIKPGDNIIEFTPDKTGTFWITCSMGMGPGSFEVVNADGSSSPSTVASASSPPPSTGGSCGASGGGCGCGMR